MPAARRRPTLMRSWGHWRLYPPRLTHDHWAGTRVARNGIAGIAAVIGVGGARPAHVFAPYVDTGLSNTTLTTVASDYGTKFFTLAFVGGSGCQWSLPNLSGWESQISAIQLGTEMGTAANQALDATAGQLEGIYGISSAAAYGMLGNTPMIGQNDTSGEIFTLAGAAAATAAPRPRRPLISLPILRGTLIQRRT
jgi:hypothetical protein